ncbi:MAG: RHS repeat-associated core domain-containing protein, partial [Bacteroidota bacterium]|nr:RHS repeat-associated core domain-containing protein [Bacteroidota bacterium]
EVDVSLKRYKYIDKERDEETGLYYFGARYYAGWMGRWISVDPLKEKYLNLTPYNYCANGPLKNIDLDGKDIYITDPNTNKSYLYVPGETAINAAKDSFVETVAKTLDELTSSGKDKFDIVSTLVGDENINANIKLGSWDDRGNTVSTELNGKIYGTIPWSPEGGVITKEGGRQSPATVLLHELGHYYFDAYDPTGELAKDKFIDIEKKKLESMVHLLTDG